MTGIKNNRTSLEEGNSRDWRQTAEVFDKRAAEYDHWFEGNLVYEIERAALQDLHTKVAGPKLEIGVGSGRFAQSLNISFGLDPARAPLLLAAQRGIIVCQAVGENLPIMDNSLGAIYLLFTLCFASNPQQVLAESFRVLSDEGHLVLGMVPSSGKWGQELAGKKKAGHAFYKHARFYTFETVMHWFQETGFQIVEARSTLYQPSGSVKKSEQPRDILDEQAGFVVLVAGKAHE